MISLEQLDALLNTLPHLRIGLLGDLFLDRYLELAPGVHELSIETGLEAYQIPQVRNSPGALGTVINNLAALGVGQMVPITVLGDDGHGYDLRQSLQPLRTDMTHVVTDPRRLTPTYTKPMRRDQAGVWQELNRLDIRSRESLHPTTVVQLIQQIREAFFRTDGLIVLDQINENDWGVVNRQVRDVLSELAASRPDKLIFVDSRRHLADFGFGVLKGNRAEVLGAVGTDAEGALPEAVRKLADRTQKPAFCTVGERGIFVAEPGSAAELVAGFSVTGPVDIVGAGDAASSGIVAALLSGCTVREAASVGNLVASITVQQLGTTGTATPAQVRARWREMAR